LGRIVLAAALGAAVLILIALFSRQRVRPVQAELVAAAGPAAELSGAVDDSFARAGPGGEIRFPADHGPHPDFQTEWWYYTGNLQTGQGRRFGYQLTFFRRAVVPPGERQERASSWAADQAYMAHFAVSDIDGQGHQAWERLTRGAVGLAGAQASPASVWLEDWSVEEIRPGLYHLQAAQDVYALDLELAEAKAPVLQGLEGYSQKGPEPGNASYYYSLTRLETAGTVQAGGASYPVTGLSWMDHEYSTSALSKEQVGWDWFSLQLSDGSEVMVFQIRRKDGTVDPFSSGVWVAPDGTTRQLEREDFEIQVMDTWRSPESGANYPAGWIVRAPELDLTLEIEPLLADQELNVSYNYWEGAVSIQGQREGRAITGVGFVELTGYAPSMTASSMTASSMTASSQTDVP
jgi:predicted secreted hydrolase